MHIVDRRLNPSGKNLANRQRFMRRAKSLIRKAVHETSASRSIKDADQEDEVSLPAQGVHEPSLHRSASGGIRDHLLPVSRCRLGSVANLAAVCRDWFLAREEGRAMSDFKGRHFEGEIVLWAVRWYCRYGVSYRDLEQMMGERGVAVDHSTIYRWVQRYAPEIEKRLRWQWRGPRSTSWRIDETYVKVRGRWTYLYRAVDKYGNTIDFYLSPTRNTAAAKRFLGKALNGLKDWQKPRIINTDKAPTYAAALAELKKEGKCPEETLHRQIKYLNNIIEADHGKLKQLIRPVRGFKTLKTAYATIKGFEVMRALRKGQASAFNITRDIRGEARIVERAFGLGASILADAVQFVGEQLKLAAA